MSNIVNRILLFLLGLPLLIVTVYFLPFYNNIGINIIAILASAIGGIEMANMLKNKGSNIPSVAGALIGASLPLTSYISVSFFNNMEIAIFSLIFIIVINLSIAAFVSSEEELPLVIPRIGQRFLLIVYPGAFLMFIPRLTALSGGTILMAIFILSVYLNDSMAYVTGKLLGKNNNNIIFISPNKSIAGFVGGLTASIAVTVSAQLIFPKLFPGHIIKSVFFGIIIGFSTIIGDLLESSIKRSCNVKDSGSIIPGRGGMLDSIDSPVFTAPLFFYLYILLF
ncbi:phosphatidate cytidylyltransferase [Spirochaetia bacterium 38H-sp]|uniref:Phosphatidate cytidylyltransferase n=1 Tax=Rarispira pelagica TaxID=3141764 RepID=A0ABU9UBY8_9SPIR